jgi:hypothetical protein
VNPDMHAFMKELMEKKFSQSFDGNTFQTFLNKYKRIYDSQSLQSSLVKNEVNKIWSELFSGFTDAWKNFKEYQALTKSLKGGESMLSFFKVAGRFIFEGLKKTFNALTWTQILKPSAVANMALRLGQKNLFLGLVYADLVLVVWKKIAKSVVALVKSFFESKYGGSDDGSDITYQGQFFEELKSIWAPTVIPQVKTYFESQGLMGYANPVDFDSIIINETIKLINGWRDNSPDVIDQRLQDTYNQMLEEFWNSLTNEQKGTAINTIEKEIVTDVAIFRNTYRRRNDNKYDIKDYENLLLQNSVTDAEVKKVIDSMILGKQDVGKIVNPNTIDKKFIFDLFNKKLNKKDVDVNSPIAAEILNSLKVSLFRTKNTEYYTISRKSTSVTNYTFFFTKIPFTPYYFMVKRKDNSYEIFYEESADKVAIPQQKKDIDKIITDYSELLKIEPKYNHAKAFNPSNRISKDTVGSNYEKISKKILDLLNNSLPTDTPPSETITMKQFANKL